MPPQKKFKISEVILGSLPGFLVGKTVGKLLKISVSQFLNMHDSDTNINHDLVMQSDQLARD